ncbi:MAG: hypothetical protein CMG01_00060 [Candidatus Marinimicrobia bacterium]|nr:hypothetical protein [Candidatus Neomarinimicrobiota bacterium]|tara:strand:+ start:10252 stop:11001 length:750 start_codon:yes stop_codon:yes gene_type:complete
MIIIQSIGQLRSKRENFGNSICYTTEKKLSNNYDVRYIPAFFLIVSILSLNKKLIFGDVRSSFSMLRRLISPKKTFFLSDGLGTEIAKIMHKKKRSLYVSTKGLPFIKKLLDKLNHNTPNFIYKKNEKLQFKSSNTIYFIGQALSENKIVDPADELKKIIQTNADYYIAHPRDSEKKIQSINKHLKIIRLNCPVENFLKKKGFKKLIGFSSSTFLNLKLDDFELHKIKYKDNWLGKDCEFAFKILKNNK